MYLFLSNIVLSEYSLCAHVLYKQTRLIEISLVTTKMAHCHPHHHHHHDKYAVIRNQKSGLVLDASDYVVKIQHFTGFPCQLWKLEEASPGKFFIVNKGNG